MIPRNAIIAAATGATLLSGGMFFSSMLGKRTAEAPVLPLATLHQQEQRKPVRLVFTGDVMLSRAVGAKMAQKDDFGYPARKVSDFFKDADIVAVNLEGPMSVLGTKVGSEYSFRMDPRSIETLKLLNVSVASLANNHMWDYGRDALVNTASILNASGILSAGAGESYEAANALRVKKARGTKFGFLSYTDLYPENLEAGTSSPGISLFDLVRVSGEIRKIKSEKRADILVVLFHWGEEYRQHPTQKQRDTAHALIDAGADLIVGHHPHVVQDVKKYKNGWIFYSLGNFIFDQYFSEGTMKGLVVEAFAENGKISEVKLWESVLNKDYQIERIEPKNLTL